jgi:hypothetical protein
MNRIFGKKKPEAPPVNVSDVAGKVDGRVTDLDMKVRVCSCGCAASRSALTSRRRRSTSWTRSSASIASR